MTHSLVIKLALIVLLSILPSLVSIVILYRVKRRWQSRLQRVRLMTEYTSRSSFSGNNLPENFYEYDLNNFSNEYLIELKKYFVGDLSCQYNAHSPYIRCAVNPEGPCQGCLHYRAK